MTADATPRTDAFANELLAGPAQSARQRTNIEWIAFARRLERELRAALGRGYRAGLTLESRDPE